MPLDAFGVQRRQGATQNIDLVLIEFCAQKQPAQLSLQLFGMIGMKKTRSREQLLEMGLEAFDLGGRRWRGFALLSG